MELLLLRLGQGTVRKQKGFGFRGQTLRREGTFPPLDVLLEVRKKMPDFRRWHKPPHTQHQKKQRFDDTPKTSSVHLRSPGHLCFFVKKSSET